jgi:hypothetical protein
MFGMMALIGILKSDPELGEGYVNQGCQMVCFQTKNPNLGEFWRVLQWKMMVYFMDTWSILRSFVRFYGHLVQFVIIWYIFSRFGILFQEKSGNPDVNREYKSNILKQRKLWREK